MLRFVHGQTRENRDTYVVLDVHGGTRKDEQEIRLPDVMGPRIQNIQRPEIGSYYRTTLKYTTIFSRTAATDSNAALRTRTVCEGTKNHDQLGKWLPPCILLLQRSSNVKIAAQYSNKS